MQDKEDEVDIGKTPSISMFHSFCVDWWKEMELQMNLYLMALVESLSILKMVRSISLNQVDIESESYSNLNGQKRIILSFPYRHESKSQQSWICHIEVDLYSTDYLETFDLSLFRSFPQVGDYNKSSNTLWHNFLDFYDALL